MADKLKDKVAIITGSGQGIGRALALALAREGASVVTNNRSAGASGGDAETTAAEIKKAGGRAFPVYADVADFKQSKRLIDSVVEGFGKIDILVNNAGTGGYKTVWEESEEEWDSVIGSCLKSAYNCTHHAAPLLMKQRWGRIINTSSPAWMGTASRCSYNAAKAGIVGLTRGVARGLGAYGITCNTYVPWVKTRLSAGPEAMALYRRRWEMGLYASEEDYKSRLNLPSPEVVCPLLTYLCTEAAANINGQVFEVRWNRISIFPEPYRQKTIFKPGELWTVDELEKIVPEILLQGYINPAPPKPQK